MDFIDPSLSTMEPHPGPYLTSINTVIVCTVSVVLILACIAPFLSLRAAKQLSACTVIIVTQIVLFFTFINGVLWPNDNISAWWNGNGLCDIEVILRTIFFTLIGSSTASLTRNLSQAVDVDNNPRLFESASMRRRRLAVEILFVFGVPFIQLVFHYFIQAGRYAIITVYGCTDVISNSWFALFLVVIWPPIFCIFNCYYAALVIIRLRRHRGRLSSTLNGSGSSFTARRFMKLFFLCLLFFILELPVTLAFFYFNLRNNIPLQSYSWSKTHDSATWPIIIYLTTDAYPIQQYYGWPPIMSGIGIVLFYGLNNEAVDWYRRFFVFIGLASIWPSLSTPRVAPRRQAGSTRSTWSSHLDIVGKAVRYFDGVRKHSVTSDSTQDGSQISTESVTTTTLTSITTHCTSPNTPDPTAPYKLHPNHTIAERPPARPLRSAFRTHYNLRFPFLPRHHHKPNTVDPEALPGPMVETSIWSGPSAPSMAQGEFLDPESPKLGSRQYREREKQENDRDEAVEQSGVKVSRSLDQTSVMSPRE